MSDAQRLATEVVKKLVRSGYKAYFAGGWVRDLLLGHPSDDIDIATDAPPDRILDLFPRTLVVGLSFGIVIVLMDGHQFEVATFRRDIDYRDGRTPSRIELATAEEDALRRDFTINGMFYDPLEEKIYDYVNGQHDLKLGVIRAIGNPSERFYEDRLRMVRAVRFSGRFKFAIDPETEEAIKENAATLFPAVAMERIWQEFVKMTQFPHFDHAILDMHRLGLLEVIFPSLKNVHLHDLRKWVEPFNHFPENTPTIVYLFQLFPKATMDDLESLCRMLKASQKEIKLAEFFISGRNLWEADPFKVRDPVAAVHFYAHPDSQLFLDVLEAKLSAEQRGPFKEFHQKQRERFSVHIQRSKQRSPLVNAALLRTQGVQPGPPMGRLLALAEQFVILHDFQRPEEVFPLLKRSPDWPSKLG